MPSSRRFDLGKALASWRRSLASSRAFTADDLDELERHLRDQVGGLVAGGMTEQEAFGAARREMGDYGTAEAEYRKVYWGKLLLQRQLKNELVWRLSMLTNYVKIAVRTIGRHPGSSFVNVAGLAVGVACCLLLGLYVHDELTYDRFHEQADRIYRVHATSQNPEGDFYRTVLPPPVAPALQETYPDLEAVTRVVQLGRSLVRVGDAVYQEDRFYLAEPSLLDVFTFPLRRGDPGTVLTEPGTVVLTETTARRYFGEDDPVGQVITFEQDVDLTVVGVVEDPPSNSHLQFDLLAALETPGIVSEGWLENWGRSAALTYVLLHPDVGPEAFEAELPAFVDAHMRESLDDEEVYALSLHALTDIHLYPHRAPEQVWATGNLKYVYTFSIIGVLMLLMACINYVNLATASAMRRAREVGVRKVLGSNRTQLVGQFLGESALLAAVALLAGVGLVALGLPGFNALSGKVFSTARLGEPVFLLGAAGLWVFVSLAAGYYPALYLSGFRPAATLQGAGSGSSGGRTPLRNGLVVVQFTAAVLLIVGTLAVHRQLSFMRHTDLGYDREHIVLVPLRDPGVWQRAAALKDEWQRLPGVEAVAFSSGVPGDVGWNSTARWGGAGAEEALEINHIMVDYDFMEVFGFDLAAGRGFSRAFPGDETAAYVLNEAAVRAIGWDEPLGKNLILWSREAPVIGVVEDFHFESLHRPIGPIAFHFGQRRYRMASLKILPTQVSETLDAVEAVLGRFIPDRPFEYAFLDETFGDLYRAEERFGRIAVCLTVLALFLASLGLLGLTASVVEQRTKEIGVRKVLGASVPALVVLLTREFARLVGIAFLIAAPLAYVVANRWLDGFAYRIEISWPIFLSAGLAALGVAVLTVSFQAIKAATADPVRSLRSL